MGTRDRRQALVELAASYDRIAEQYASQFFDELDRKPFDRDLLNRFADRLRPGGLVCDLGCGPGQVARHLWDRGIKVCGVDLSAAMLGVASRLSREITFTLGDMSCLPVADEAFSGIVAFYSIIHCAREEASRTLKEMARVLEPGGTLLLAFHGGHGEVHAEEWFGEVVSIDATFFERAEMAMHVTSIGLLCEHVAERPPYDFEHATNRVYILAQKPQSRGRTPLYRTWVSWPL